MKTSSIVERRQTGYVFAGFSFYSKSLRRTLHRRPFFSPLVPLSVSSYKVISVHYMYSSCTDERPFVCRAAIPVSLTEASLMTKATMVFICCLLPIRALYVPIVYYPRRQFCSNDCFASSVYASSKTQYR